MISEQIAEQNTFFFDNLPESLQKLIKKALCQHYQELYEANSNDQASLQDTLNEILQLFQENHSTLAHLRYLWMTLILVLMVKPTFEYYDSDHPIVENTIAKLQIALFNNLEKTLNPKQEIFPDFNPEEENLITHSDFDTAPKIGKIASLQIWFETLDVYKSAIKTLDFNQSLSALLDILDNILEGYALFPGSEGRRELFDWLLKEVVPCSWYLLPPSSIYETNESSKINNIQLMSKLKKVSDEIWSMVLQDSINKNQGNDNNRLEQIKIKISSKF